MAQSAMTAPSSWPALLAVNDSGPTPMTPAFGSDAPMNTEMTPAFWA